MHHQITYTLTLRTTHRNEKLSFFKSIRVIIIQFISCGSPVSSRNTPPLSTRKSSTSDSAPSSKKNLYALLHSGKMVSRRNQRNQTLRRQRFKTHSWWYLFLHTAPNDLRLGVSTPDQVC